VVHFVQDTLLHEHPQWEVLSSDEKVTLARERSLAIPRYPFQSVSWLCNHCSDYLAPQAPFRFGCLVLSGVKRNVIEHIKTVCVRSLAALPIPHLHFYRHNIDNPVGDVDFFLYPISGGGMPFQLI
jgi:hypothetical protein